MRATKRLLATLALVLAIMGLGRVDMAWAASDRVDSWKINYVVNADGTVDATETLVYRFGSNSQRHGIQRFFTVREPYDDSHDATYEISNISVTSPDASNQFTQLLDDQGRDEFLVLRIGSQNRTISTPTATYTISYRVSGAMRSFTGYDEFYWDAISGETPNVGQVQVTATVPGGVQQVSCFSGPVKGVTPCTNAKIVNGQAVWTQQGKPAGSILSVGAKIETGQVADNKPHLVTRADAADQKMKQVGLGATGLAALVAPLIGWLHWRRRGRDLRYIGLPPGVIPGPGEANVEKPAGDVEVPVAFSPPRIPIAEAGLLADGQIDTTETTATLVELAVLGAIQLSTDDGASARLLDPSRATSPHQQVLLDRLFGHSNGEVDLARGSMLQAHQALTISVRNQVARNRWFTDLPGAKATGCGYLVVGGAMLAFFGLPNSFSMAWLYLTLPLLPIGLVWMVLRARMARGQRTGLGRALTDQIEGFRLYLATAEADQLRFEEGEDIFSRYLPWAILFGLTDRWADLCAQLVRMGRLSAEPPVWYYGSYSNWNYYVFNDSLRTIDHAAHPVPPSPSAGGSSGSGWGGGSSFGGGGFSGGGGGGGGVGSW